MTGSFAPFEPLIERLPATNQLLGELYESFENWCQNRVGAFTFKYDEGDERIAKLLVTAQNELKGFILGGEHACYQALRENAMLFFPDTELAQLHVARGHCPRHQDEEGHFLPTKKVYRIGVHIPEEEFKENAESIDQRLADKYPPVCDICGTADNHPTTSNYLRILPAEFLPSYEAIDAIEKRIARDTARHLNAGRQKQYFSKLGKSVAAVYAKEEHQIGESLNGLKNALSLAEQSLEARLMSSNCPVLFVQGRIKGVSRLQDKILRMLVKRYLIEKEHVRDLEPVLDVIGNKVITLEADGQYGTEAIAERIVNFYGPNSVYRRDPSKKMIEERISTDAKGNVILDASGQPVFRAHRMDLLLGEGTTKASVSLQVEQYHVYQRDKKDHKDYEERQQEYVRLAEEIPSAQNGFPASRMREEIAKLIKLG